jgi:hypothetical protein
MRRRFIQINGELVEVAEDYVSQGREAKNEGLLWNDRAYQDANDPRFSSRTQHKQFMRDNNLTTIDDYSNTWKDAERNRIRNRAGYDPQRKQDIASALRRMRNGYKPILQKE